MKFGIAIGFVTALAVGAARANSFEDFNLAANALNRGDNDSAIRLYSHALASGDLMSSLKLPALLGRANAYVREKHYSDAIPDANSALEFDPASSDAMTLRMRAFEGTGQYALAAADCDWLLRARPRSSELYSRCAYVRWQNADFAEAVSYFTTAVGLPKSPVPIDVLWLEIARWRAGTSDEAQFARIANSLNLAAWITPVFDLYLGNIGPDAALAPSQKALGQSQVPSDTMRDRRCEIVFFVGEWQFQHRNIAAALALFQEAASNCPDWLAPSIEAKRLAQK
jgi:tetratricopeptide (TPR) repeat protein